MNRAGIKHLAIRSLSVDPDRQQDIKSHNDLKYPANGWRRGWFALLIGNLLAAFLQSETQLALCQGVDQQCQPHDHDQSQDVLGFLEKQAVGEEKWLFEEAKSTLDEIP